jgi:two-component system chemotaxis response regulator CheB
MRIKPDRTISLVDGKRIRQVRSSANPLFETASRVFGPHVIAVVLSGFDSDGTDGVQAVRKRGGTVIAQDRATSPHFDMPRSAIATGAVNLVLPADRIGPALVSLATTGSFDPPENHRDGHTHTR